MDADLLAAHARCLPHSQRLRLGPRPEGEEAVPATAYQDAAFLRARLEARARRLGTDDLRAVGSVWAKHYIGALLPGVLALAVLEGLGLDARATHVQIHEEDGLPAAARIEAPRATRRHEGAGAFHAAAFAPLLEHHFRPLFATLERACGLWQGVAWNSAGNTAAWDLERFAAASPEATRADREILLDDPASPMHDPVFPEDLRAWGIPEAVQVRRACCLRYRLPDTTECYTCPRLSPGRRAALVKKLGVKT